MVESDTASVECPLCGEAFDPTAAGGWCTNSECGEWQYETDVTPDQQTESNENGRTSDDESGSVSRDAESDSDADSSDAGVDADEADGEADASGWGDDAETDAASANEPSDAPAGSEVDADALGEDAVDDDEVDEPAADDAPADDGADETNVGDDDGDAADETTFDCPDCGASLDADVNFCPDCGEDVGDLPNEADELDACPSCGADVDADDNFCVQCGEDLDAHRGANSLDACPDCGADVDEGDAFCAGCGADLDAHRSGDVDASAEPAADDVGPSGSDPEPAPDALALTAHGKSVVVGDGDAVGREIRSLLTEAGRPEDEAVRVHREHVRFVRESGQFHVVALGQNPTRVNGTSLSEGDREPVAPGDEIELSEVVALRVEAA